MDQLITYIQSLRINIRYENDILMLEGNLDRMRKLNTFISNFKTPLWLDIPNTTKIMIVNVMIDKDDNNYGGDMWCLHLMLKIFGGNIEFINCWYVGEGLRMIEKL
jgi:hypothetical protein